MLELWTLWALLVLYALLRASFGAMRATGPGLFKHIGPTLVLPLASLSCMQQSLLDFAPFFSIRVLSLILSLLAVPFLFSRFLVLLLHACMLIESDPFNPFILDV